MAIIGVRHAYINGQSLGKVTSVSVTLTRTQLSALQQFKTITTGATISLVSIGGFNPTIFNENGWFRWVTVELENNQTIYKVNEISNVVLQEPDISGTTKQETVDFATYDITGQSWNCTGIRTTIAMSDADAKTKAIEGWDDPTPNEEGAESE